MSAQDSTYNWLRQRIVTLPRHEATFLSEVALATEAGVSRTPVREALLRLEAEGWLRILPRKGALISPISDAEVDAVMQARLLVEEWGVREVVERGEQLVDRLDALVQEQCRCRDDPATFIDLDREFHRTIVTAAGNPVLSDFYESLRDRQLRMGLQAMVTDADRAEQVVTEHRAIVDGLRNLNQDDALLALHGHLDKTLSVLRSAPAFTPLRGITSRR
ncbi:MAG TPA: GntR family transcriptional regulator [Pseudonocardia sp.]|uniref:GntR family transcriptional regulator n=1 Tax=Pseudonocardia sp. TaxID=60912 RepID=UPI002CD33729|nr:GntR family transcriptional regulator [Pseudonocardia sp.]HTF52600.1 GntR family transcriptional regulator [Pseudonocardia sp.]